MISIITTAYNIENYLPLCLDSILAQTVSDFELLLLDDGSTDHSGMICDQYAKKDSRIRVIHQENAGVSDTWNGALPLVKGEYVGFVDGDDIIHPRMFELLYKAIQVTQSDIAYCSFQRFNGDGSFEFENDETMDHSEDRDFIRISTKEQEMASNVYNAMIWKGLYRLSVIKPFRFLSKRNGQDNLWSACVLLNSGQVARVDKVLYAWRRREGSESYLAFRHRLLDYLVVKNCIIDYLEEHAPEWIVTYTIALFTTCVDVANRLPMIQDESEKASYQKEIRRGREYLSKISMREILTDPYMEKQRKLLAAIGKISFPLACFFKRKLLLIINR